MSIEKNLLFELSWEVCNKVGGIHTVIASKVFEVQQHFSQYFCIGPYKNQGADIFDEQEPPEWMKKGIISLKEKGIIVHYGIWNIEGFPEVLLIDYQGYSSQVNSIKGKLWDMWEVDSLGTQWFDFDEVLLWSWVSGIVISELTNSKDTGELESQTLVHAHEWMSGGAIAYLNSLKTNSTIKTIFTTHATMLGRTIFGSGGSLDILEKKSPLQLAEELGIKTKFQLEKALAHNSDCFTTVSDITSKEAEIIYEKTPDVITYNGFDSNNNDLYVLEKQYVDSRNKIDKFLIEYFYDFFNYNSKDTYLMYTSGRYELKNKGVDIIVKALSKLNQRLLQEESEKELVFWFMLMFGEYEMDNKVKESLEHKASGQDPLRHGYAPLSPYALPLDNELVRELIAHNLVNNEDSPVKVIVTPTQFDGRDGLVNLEYYKLISGFDLGVFPSLYEPWGYTPAESLAYGVPAVSSDLCGIGKKACEFSCDSSFKILERKEQDDERVIKDLAGILYLAIHESPKVQMRNKVQSKLCSQKFSWKVFYKNYMEAYRSVNQ